MRLTDLLTQIPGLTLCSGSAEKTVTHVTADSCAAQAGGLFVAVAGQKTDGHDFINDAIENGADVNLRDSDGDTPILLCEDPASFEVLETNGANLNVKNNSNEGFLEKATELAQEENTEMVTYLFNRDLIPVNFAIQTQLDSNALVDGQQIHSPTRGTAATAHARKDNSPKQP